MRLLDIPLDRIRGADGVVPPKGLVQSMRAVGLIHPILVAPVYASGDYTVIAGRKRLAAARELGWATIPVQISAHLIRDLLPLHENLHRAPSPALEARIIGDLVAQGMSQREVAHALGVSQAQVSQRLALLTLVPQALEMLDRGELKPSLARGLAKLPPGQQEALLAGEPRPTLAGVQACRRQRKLEALADLPLPPTPGPQPPPEEQEDPLFSDFLQLYEAAELVYASHIQDPDHSGRCWVAKMALERLRKALTGEEENGEIW